MRLLYTEEFKKDLNKIKNKSCQIKIKKIIQKIMENPDVGKPLKYELTDLMSIRISKSRLLYRYKDNTIVLLKFEHRKNVYK
jgi:mRNA-degrading endonuclease RelE of RelBE toxin-antitoxin system